MALERILIVPDSHHPYVDRRAWNLLLKVARKLNPQYCVILGDFVDCFCISDHPKDPNRARLLESEIASGKDALTDLGQVLGITTKKYFIAGNHEYRLERYLMNRAPELFNIVKIEKLLQLKKLGWSYTPYRKFLRIGKLFLTHDCGSAGAYAHFRAETVFGGNVVIGHTHRLGSCYIGNAKGSPHTGQMFGWLGDVNRIDYTHRIQALRDWSLGFGVGCMEPNGTVHLSGIPIIDYHCVVEGQLFRG